MSVLGTNTGAAAGADGTAAAGAADAAAAAATTAAAAAGTPAADATNPGTAAAANAETPAGTGAAVGEPGKETKTGEQPGDGQAAQGAPDKYELVIPDGGLLEQSDLDAFAAAAKAKGLTNEQAQAALTEHAQALEAQATRFLETTQAHPEVGGANLEAAQANAQRVLEKFLPAATPEGAELRKAMDKSGYGNYAPFVVLLSRIGRAMSEDQPMSGTRTGGARRSHAEVLFGDAK